MKSNNNILQYKNLNDSAFSESKNRDKLFNRYFIDHLTNLPNIYQLRNDLEDADDYSLIILSIDDMQTIKNFYGYLASDYVIEEVGTYLKNNIDGKVYKLTSDEFAIVIVNKMYFYNLKDYLQSLYENMNDTAIQYNVHKIYINLTLSSSSSQDNTNIFSKVYMALKYAMDINTPFWIYEDNMNFEENYAKHLYLSSLVREAVSSLQIIPYFQAIVDTKTLRIRKYECLARLIDENGKIVSPNIFIPIAKKIKNYHIITKTIIDKSFAHFETIECEFTINLSIEDIVKRDMFEFITNKLKGYKVPERVTFEILESDAIEDFDKVNSFINEVRRYGAKIAIDDFGSGYSNFSYLTKMKIDYIKIDGSLIKNMDTDDSSLIVVETIVQFAKKLGIKTVAEYVHSETILDKVKELESEYSQGFHFSKPSMLTKSNC